MMRTRACISTVLAVALLVTGARAAHAQAAPGIPGHTVDLAVDGAVIGVGAAGALLAPLIPARGGDGWRRELFGAVDERVKANLSPRAAHLSDALLVTTIAVPAALLLGDPIDRGTGERYVVYAESISTNLLLNALAKYGVQRPRPYTYSRDPRAHALATAKDARLSFYSGHAAIAFGSAVTGAYLHAARTTDPDARAVVWGVELALASATANLRVRAGKHFYSDVVVGAVVGAGVGYLVPALHADDGGRHAPSAREYLGMGAGLALGVLGSQLVPLERDVPVEGGERPPRVTARLVPMAVADGAGVLAVGTF